MKWSFCPCSVYLACDTRNPSKHKLLYDAHTKGSEQEAGHYEERPGCSWSLAMKAQEREKASAEDIRLLLLLLVTIAVSII
mmetsp:Transcript_98432/g.175302  ORF Transcript_98432/g.175302 Transcript_98432/m.175302 type:complete len:81 (-) Transcript_98432:564-806(-)